MATPTPTPAPSSTPSATPSASPSPSPSGSSGSGLGIGYQSPLLPGVNNGLGMYAYQPKTVKITDLTQTSQPDIASIVNGAMLSLVGRAATPEEIARYGAELLAAQKANPGGTNTTLNYDPTTGKPATETGTQLTSGVEAQSFIDNIIRGTAEAQQYNIMGTYMDSLQAMTDKFKGSYNG